MMESNSGTAGWRNYSYLFFVSFLSLFLEVLLIRWIGTEIRIFAYFRNLVLISCFLGLGIGFCLKKFSTGLLTTLALTAVLVAVVNPNAELSGVSARRIPEYLIFPEMHVWYSAVGKTSLLKLVGGFAMVSGLMAILAGIFMPFGQIMGKIFDNSDNRIRDYSVNLLGSLTGTWAFALMSYLNTPPWTWFLAAGMIAAILIWPKRVRALAALALLIPILLLSIDREPPGIEVFWSPYQQIMYRQSSQTIKPGLEVPYYKIAVNSVIYMFVFDLSYDMAERYPGAFDRKEAPYYPYDLPFRFQPDPGKVLIVGAGAGNDVAAALRNNAAEIDAVEIDPVIARLGIKLHPEKPYQNPKVNLVIDDARSFFKKSKTKYDLIIFGALDSHTLTSNFTNINLDSYVYTLESIREAKGRLKNDGIIIISFLTERPWLGHKIYSMASNAFGHPPVVFKNFDPVTIHGVGGTVFLCGDNDQILARLQNDPKLRDKFNQSGPVLAQKYAEAMEQADFGVPEDDWPYLYLKNREIPTPHLVMIAIIAGLMILAVKFLFPAGKIGPSHFLFLGAGFMLVEVHSISKIALLFGSTWMVNVVIISAILVMILCANLLVLKFKVERVRYWYAGLFLTLALAYLVPVQSFLFGGYLGRGLLVGSFYSLPLFFAGVIFASSIRKVVGVDAAFASNMLGAAIGGMLESASFVFGLKAVVLIAIALYLASAIALKKMPVINSPQKSG